MNMRQIVGDLQQIEHNYKMLSPQHQILEQPILLKSKDYIDLRSDVVSVPPPEMLKAMSEAEVGDDVFEDDPTANRFQQVAADYFGFEASLIVPSTTMANLISVLLYTKPGDQVIIWGNAHTIQRESAGIAMIGGVQTRQILQQSGVFTLDQIRKRVRKSSQHITFPDTSLIMIENPTFTGQVWPLSSLQALKQFAEKEQITLLMDGARILNALAHYNINHSQVHKYCDIMTMCLSKGLCCPFGSLVLGKSEIIKKSRHIRKSLGGGMRQVGIIGAAGLYALQNMITEIKEDNQMAMYLGSELCRMKGIEIDRSKIQSNMVNFGVSIQNFNHDEYHKHLLLNGLKIKPFNQDRQQYRLVTHRTIRKQECQKFIQLTNNFLHQNYYNKTYVEERGAIKEPLSAPGLSREGQTAGQSNQKQREHKQAAQVKE